MNFTYKQIWLINYPVMMSLLIEQLINITDAIFLGRVGEVELGASALAGIYYMAIYMLGFGFSLGLQVLIARRNGEGRLADTGRAFFQGVYFLLVLAVAVFALSKLFSPLLLRSLIKSDDVYQAVVEYIRWRDYGFLFAFPVLAYRAFFVGITKTGILTVNSVVMLVANILFNYWLIFGKMGMPALGISGAAMASSLSGLVSLLFFVIYMCGWLPKDKYGLSVTWDFKVLKELFNLSVWTMVRSFFCVAPWFLFFIAIEHLGKSQLAVANVVRSISTIFFVVVNSFATTTSALVSNLIGAGKQTEVLSVCRKIIRLSYGTGLPLIVLTFICSDWVLRIYTNDEALIRLAYYPFLVMLSNYFLAVPGYTYCNAVIGTGHTRLAFGFQVMTIVIYLFYLYLISSCMNVPLAVYWTAEHLYVVLLFVFSYIYMRKDWC